MMNVLERNESMAKSSAFVRVMEELHQSKPAGAWRADRRFKQDYEEVLRIAEAFRASNDTDYAMYGFRVQMLISEFMETDALYHEKIVHLREVRNQEELLHLSLQRALEAEQHILMTKEADQNLRKSI